MIHNLNLIMFSFGLHSEVKHKDIAGSIDHWMKSADNQHLSRLSMHFQGYGSSESHASGVHCMVGTSGFPNNHNVC